MLDSQYKDEPYSIEESKVVRKPKKKRKSSKKQRQRARYLRFGGVILAVTVAIGVIEWYVVFHAKTGGIILKKTFEGAESTDGP